MGYRRFRRTNFLSAPLPAARRPFDLAGGAANPTRRLNHSDLTFRGMRRRLIIRKDKIALVLKISKKMLVRPE